MSRPVHQYGMTWCDSLGIHWRPRHSAVIHTLAWKVFVQCGLVIAIGCLVLVVALLLVQPS